MNNQDRRLLLGVAATMAAMRVLASDALAQDAARPPSHELSQEFNTLRQAYADAEQKWFAGMGQSHSPDWATHPAFEYIPKFKKLAEAQAGKPDAFGALVWLLENPPPWVTSNLRAADSRPDANAAPSDPNAPSKPRPTDERAWALERFKRDHLADPALADETEPFFDPLIFNLDKTAAVELFETILAKHPNRNVKARALFSMARTLYNPFAMPGPGQTDPAEQEKRIAADQKRAGELFRKLAADYAGTAAAKDATPYLFELEHLQVGMKAPDIEGTDIDGKPIKLSDFKGKVIVLDFWGFW